MPKFLDEIIQQINYHANFGYLKPNEVPNEVYKNDADACRQYSDDVREHVKKVMDVWFNDTGIEQAEQYEHGTTVAHKYPSHSLRWIAEHEFNVSEGVLLDVDAVIRSHDRSRYTDDEFYPMGNAVYSAASHTGGNINNPLTSAAQAAYDLARVKHYNRNPHHTQHYVYNDRDTSNRDGEDVTIEDVHNFDNHEVIVNPLDGTKTYIYDYFNIDRPRYAQLAADMNEVFIWEMIADWIATIADDFPQPFIYYWGSKYKTYMRPYYYYDYTIDTQPDGTEEDPSGFTITVEVLDTSTATVLNTSTIDLDADSEAVTTYYETKSQSKTEDVRFHVVIPDLGVDTYVTQPVTMTIDYQSPYEVDLVTLVDADVEMDVRVTLNARVTVVFKLKTDIYHDTYRYYLRSSRIPLLPQNIPVSESSRQRIETIVERWRPLDDGGQDDIYDQYGYPVPVADLPIGRQNAEQLYHEKVAEEKKEYTKTQEFPLVREWKHRQQGEEGDGPLELHVTNRQITQSHMSVYPQS